MIGVSLVSFGGVIVFQHGIGDDCGATIVENEDVTVCPHCGSKHAHQDEDVLDTWFSSGALAI